MKEIGQVTCLVHDCGLFLPLARRMAEACKRVIWFNPDRRAFPSMKQGTVGDGFENIEVVEDYWPLVDAGEIDLACFPDIGHSGLQLHLESQGVRVWGSRSGDRYERWREMFMATVKDIGLDVPPFEVIKGLRDLEEAVRDREDLYFKISNWRGDMETFHYRNWKMDRTWFDWMAVNLGPFQNHVRFLVFEAIKTPLEIGADTYNVNGNWPSTLLNGLESKDTTYFGAVSKRGELPEQLNRILDAFGWRLAQYDYRNQISFEVRVKDEKAYWIDATQRGGMPSSGSQQLCWKNFPEIVWHGANGELVEPEPESKFTIECMVTTKTGKECYDIVELPEAIDRNVRFSNCAFVDGCYVFAPDEFHSGELGWLIALGDTPRETLDNAKALADQLPDGLDANLENLVGLIQEVEEAEKKGIPFTKEPMPGPEEVVAD